MMAESQENGENFHLSLHGNGFSRDALHNFVNGEEQEAVEEVELTLGLSLNGRFGMDPKRDAKKLKRSSSISNLVFTVGDGGTGGNGPSGVAFEAHSPLTRTSSLPADPPMELRRRKELQSMRRMEARKKRMEKLKNVRIGKEKENFNEENGCNRSNGVAIGSTVGNWTVNGVIGSKDRVSSGIPEFQSQHAEGVTQRAAELKCTSSVPSLPNQIPQRTIVGTTVNDDAKETALKNIMLDMPLVSTRGSGLNGRRIEGFLYRYKKGDDVRIVCVCHGNFYSPTEFVKHAGGGNVEHPLRHIVVSPSPFVL
ncbi:Ninja-family protein AFP3 [Abeliophyllum distichum]|uniref:Ninja-family protein n=1 Tax=Abeliophyllum distichum TaxID=126358 RepID=A0ABD1V3W1_9LAMI